MSDKKDKETILLRAVKKLDKIKEDLLDQITDLEEQKAGLEDILSHDKNRELDEFDSSNIMPELNRIYQRVVECKENMDSIDEELDYYRTQSGIMKYVKNYNYSPENFKEFLERIGKVVRIVAPQTIRFMSIVSKVSGIKYPYDKNKVTEYDELYNRFLVYEYNYRDAEKQGLNPSKRLLVSSIQEVVKGVDIDFFDTTIEYLTEVKKVLDSRIEQYRLDAIKIRQDEKDRKLKDIEKIIKDVQSKIDDAKKKLDIVEETYRLYEEYKEKTDHESIVKLSGELSKLDAIAKRELKVLRHVTKEKEKKKKEEPKNEQYVPIKIINENKDYLDGDYYLKRDTQNIICFLGDDDDTIMEDLYRHFDNSLRPLVLRELVDLFKNLYTKRDFILLTGGNPGVATSKKTHSLLESPFDFDYRRFGVSKDKYRIHAITRHSNFLEEQGYGTGNIIFFGALGVNEDNRKTEAYDRVGRRGIDKIAVSNKPAQLRPSFDFIEHITRGYVPESLLSEEDKKKISLGKFFGKLKGTNLEKSIEDDKYILFDALDEESKHNALNELNKYFIKQTTKLFSIIDEAKKKDDGILD